MGDQLTIAHMSSVPLRCIVHVLLRPRNASRKKVVCQSIAGILALEKFVGLGSENAFF